MGYPIKTEDPAVVIIDRVPGSVIYEDILVGTRWKITGTCNQCGQCEVGALPHREAELSWSAEPGMPGACIDLTYSTRLDVPVTPKISQANPACSLRGEWL